MSINVQKKKSVLNRAQAKKVLLQLSKDRRGGKFTRVSKELLDELEAWLVNHMEDIVHSHLSVGKTLMASKVGASE